MSQILIINLGSTSSKVAVFNNKVCVAEELLQHDISITQLSLLEQETYRVKS
ncbi:butyrate kinase, partial [Staphylococcus condimenti]